MVISKLFEELEYIKKEHGDLKVIKQYENHTETKFTKTYMTVKSRHRKL